MGKIVKEIIWTNRARNDLNDIFEYYLEISDQLASNIISKIIKKVESRRDSFSEIGQIEPLLIHKAGEYRYIVEGNYKIIYQLMDDRMYINTVFDARQNPNKMEKKINNEV